MASAGIRKGDKVTASDGSGPVMDVLAASDHWAICAWGEGSLHEAVLELRRLRKAPSQQQAQPQPPPGPTPER